MIECLRLLEPIVMEQEQQLPKWSVIETLRFSDWFIQDAKTRLQQRERPRSEVGTGISSKLQPTQQRPK